MGVACASLALLFGCDYESKEMRVRGFDHISPIAVAYRDGSVAEITRRENDGNISEIAVMSYNKWDTDEYSRKLRLVLPAKKYHRSDGEVFDRMKADIAGDSNHLTN